MVKKTYVGRRSDELRGGWVETFTGKKFYPLNPYPDEVNLFDIAHSLSLICRFNGHCKHFYSVAQHSLNVYRVLRKQDHSPLILLYGLLHDASEAYISDLTQPVKKDIPGYKNIEVKVQAAIWEHLHLCPPPKLVWEGPIHLADTYVLHEEGRILMPYNWDDPGPPSDQKLWGAIAISEQIPQTVERIFLSTVNHLRQKI